MKRFYLLPIVCCALSISLSAQENNGTATTSGADDNRILSADSLITTDARLDSLYQTLPEVMITGERPIARQAGVRPAPPYPEPPRRQCLRCRERASRRHRDEWRAAVGRPGSHRYPGRQSNHPQHRAALFLAAQHPCQPHREGGSDVQRPCTLPGAWRTDQYHLETIGRRPRLLARRTLCQVSPEA